MSALLAIIASLITGIGGHFINRRWDRALLFFVLLVLWLLGMTVRMYWSMRDGGMLSGNEMMGAAGLVSAGLGAIWLLSVLVTAYDAFRPKQEFQHRWTVSGAASALLLTLFALTVWGYYGLYVWNFYVSTKDYVTDTSYTAPGYDKHFSKYIYFGRLENGRMRLPKPPAGEAYLSGRFMYLDQPAAGVTLSVVLNGEYESEPLTTDEQGLFHVRVPPGEWYVTLIKTQSWKSRPKVNDGFIVLKGDEPLLKKGGSYSRYAYRAGGGVGKQVLATEQPTDDPLTLVIRDQMALVWPSGGEDPARATAQDSVIKWQGYPGASQYLVEVSRIERKGMTTSYWTVASRQIESGTSLALSGLKAVPASDEAPEYRVQVYAFDTGGKLLSESTSHGLGADFVLDDGNEFVEESKLEYLGDTDALTSEQMLAVMRNGKRLDAADVLIQEGFFDEADALLQRVLGKSEPGNLEAMKGYLAASRGQCVEADRWFEAALSAGGKACVPERYRRACRESVSPVAGQE